MSNTNQTIGKVFQAPNLLQIAMPMGGIGAGCICLNGYGGIQDYSIRHKPALSAVPTGHTPRHAAFALLHIKGDHSITKLIEGPVPPEKIYDQGLQAEGYRQSGHEGLPRFENCAFENHYPFGHVVLDDPEMPLQATVTGWNPFIPLDDIASGMPCGILDYTFTNTSVESVEFEFSYHLSHLSVSGHHWNETRNSVLHDEYGGGIFFSDTFGPNQEEHGSAAVYIIGQKPKIKAMWFRGDWFDAVSVLWREASTGKFTVNDGTEVNTASTRNGGSLLVANKLAPGESITYPIVIAWHFPNSFDKQGVIESAECGVDCDCGPARTEPAWKPFYAGQWADAREVVQSVSAQYERLRSRTEAFSHALFSSTLPVFAIDAIASNLAILKSPTVLRQENGNVWGWEGCYTDCGCCPGSCTHVWNYAQSLPHLFPALERTLREQEWMHSMDERGHVNFRSALPNGPTTHTHHAAADGQLGGPLKLFRDWHISGDRDWLARLYPYAKLSLDYSIETWDPERNGLVTEPHHNTYDIEFWGSDGMCTSIYIGALSAMAQMARALNKLDDARQYEELANRGAKLLEESLFNGEYYHQKVQWAGLRDTSFAEKITEVSETSSEPLRLLKIEGPKYQYAAGCLSDGVIGAWMAQIYGVETPLNKTQVRSTLQAIVKHNFKSDLFHHVSTQRPGYAMGHEAGLVLCTWPQGDRLTLPFPYSDEVWTGIEYQVASHLIEEGFAEEGLTLVQAVRSRYEGRTRNPFNEYECGSYYARAMASYALLGSLAGFRYCAVTKTLWFGPKINADNFKTFFCTASGFGTISLNAQTLLIEMLEGELTIDHLQLTHNGNTEKINWEVVATVRNPAVFIF